LTERITCEKWFDGSYWSATVPKSWQWRQDRNKKNYPYVFESPAGSRMQVGTSRDAKRSGPAESVPDDVKSESEKLTYLIAASSARIDHWWIWRGYPRILFPLIRSRAIMRRDVGALTGFTYEQRLAPDRKGWAGPFSDGRWMLWVYFAASDWAFAADSETALLILASFTFHAA
jgi:hypothetical protein